MTPAVCNRNLCTKKAMPGRPYCREHMHCDTIGCKVRRANYRAPDGTWHCRKHISRWRKP